MTIDDDLLMKLISERNELFEATLRMVEQHCSGLDDNTLQTGFLSANAFALRTLGPLGGVKITSNGYGRGVWADAVADKEAYVSSGKWANLFTPEQWEAHVEDEQEKANSELWNVSSFIPDAGTLDFTKGEAKP